MTGYAYHVFQQKMLEDVKDEERRELLKTKLNNEKLIEAMKDEQSRHSSRNKELQTEIERLSAMNNRIKKLI